MSAWIGILLWVAGGLAGAVLALYAAAPLVWRRMSKDLDATFKLEDADRAANPAPGQEKQGFPLVTLMDDGSYAISFGPGRSLSNGTLMVHIDGEAYWAGEIINAGDSTPDCTWKRLVPVGTPAVEVYSDAWGPATRHAMTWQPEGKDATIETWITAYTSKPVVRFGIRFNGDLHGTATGERHDPIFKFPLFTMHGPNRRVFTYRVQVFCPPMKRFRDKDASTQGPVIFYDNALNSVLIGPVDHFPLARTGKNVNGGIFHGIEGRVESIPAGYVHESLALFDTGINSIMVEYGSLLHRVHGVPARDPHDDLFTGTLGYWTDNGAYYYYRTEPGMGYHDTLVRARRIFQEKGIPVRYFQLDSCHCLGYIFTLFSARLDKISPLHTYILTGITENSPSDTT